MESAGLQTAVAVIVLAVSPLVAARPIELSDYYRIETAATPAISPDGRWVVFVRNYTIEAENHRHSERWIAPADGSAAATRLTTPAFNASAPRWSPDANRGQSHVARQLASHRSAIA
jgi:acylaminoacyl-peptidase